MAPLPVELAESPDLYDLLCRQQFPGVLSLDPPWGGRRSCMILAVVIAEPTCTFINCTREPRCIQSLQYILYLQFPYLASPHLRLTMAFIEWPQLEELLCLKRTLSSFYLPFAQAPGG